MKKARTTGCLMILNQNNEYAAVLDACVLVPMPLCDTLLRLAEEPALFRPLWSKEIFQEVGAALETKLKLTSAQRERRLKMMAQAFPEAMVEVPASLLSTYDCLPDKEDRHVLSCAVKGQANAIITNNIRDFPPECLEEFGVLCQTPDEFLGHQFHLNPSLILEKLDQQAAAIAKAREYIICRLKKVTPQFCNLLTQAI
ncbi:MAG TPA: PIN domain-containing protein [Candidatus Angelobacter sp.]|nr:PIN domain-containing protein [Candidatus Angelobacter sp.]